MDDIDWPGLRTAATRATAHSYAPYSKLRVGAAGVTDDGRVVSGCNVENASYGLTLCAECGLVSALHMSGGGRLRAVVCVDGTGALLAPCGRCRQLLYEAGGSSLLVLRDNGPVPITALLPEAFGPDDLPWTALDIIRAKRDGHELTDEQIDWFIQHYTDGTVPDEQAAALLMAIVFRSMTPGELAKWTAAMIDSGERLDLSALDRPTADKHSTGGVGDKVSLVLAPIIAACGVAMPQLSGRGLGHTGGTLDKLEAIPGWRARLDNDEVIAILRDVGAVICAPGDALCPADRKLYALRDITGTVESIPLISSSIMSKKIAEGTGALVLDVKIGAGSFLADDDLTRELARTMVGIGNDNGVKTVALLTDMEWPLGRTAGNAVEVTESVETLAGGGPADLVEVTLALAREMLALAGVDADPAAVLRDGRAMDHWRRMIRAQGGDPDATLAVARERHIVTAERDGYVRRLDCRAVGNAVWRLGAGRARKEDAVSATAGAICHAKPGERVTKGQAVLELLVDDARRLADALAALDDAIEIGDAPPAPRPLIAGRIGPD